MDVILIAAGILIAIGLLIQFRLATAKGFMFIVAAVGSFFGVALFKNGRKKRLRAELQRREIELKRQEERLAHIKARYALPEREAKEAEEAIRRDRVAYMKSILMIDAEAENNAEVVERMTPEEVLRAFAKNYSR